LLLSPGDVHFTQHHRQCLEIWQHIGVDGHRVHTSRVMPECIVGPQIACHVTHYFHVLHFHLSKNNRKSNFKNTSTLLYQDTVSTMQTFVFGLSAATVPNTKCIES
jgi:hypothetical protein